MLTSGILSISRRAVQRFNSPSSESIQSFAIGSHNHATLFMLYGASSEKWPHLTAGSVPILKQSPSSSCTAFSKMKTWTLSSGFKETDTKSAPYIYKELTKIPFVCICSEEKKAASLAAATPDNIKDEKLTARPQLPYPRQASTASSAALPKPPHIRPSFLRIGGGIHGTGAVRLWHCRHARAFHTSLLSPCPHTCSGCGACLLWSVLQDAQRESSAQGIYFAGRKRLRRFLTRCRPVIWILFLLQ